MQVLNVTGMTCGGCAKSVEKAVLRAAPEAAPKVDLAAGKVSLADGIDTGPVIQAIERAGFGATPA